MKKEFKQSFFSCLLVVLLIISNLIGMKLTNFLDLTISCDFLTYPFTFLCTLLILNMGGKKSAYQGVLIASLIQIFIVISYSLTVMLGTQTMIPDSALYVNNLFKVNELNILASLIAFLVSHYTLIYIYDAFSKAKKELYGIVLGLLGAFFSNAVIFLVITLNGQDALFIINMLLSNIIISIIMIVIITILFYLLKEKNPEPIKISNMEISVTNRIDSDMAIEDIIDAKKAPEKKKKKSSSKYPKNSTKRTNKNYTNKKPVNKKKTKTSQTKVNKSEK